MCKSQHGLLLRCRFCFERAGQDPGVCFANKLPGEPAALLRGPRWQLEGWQLQQDEGRAEGRKGAQTAHLVLAVR